VENRRVASPLCRHFGPCGGCDWQDLPYAAQLERKERRLNHLLRSALGRHAPDIAPTIGMRVDATGWPWQFRHKASFVFGDVPGGTGLAIGHFAAHSRTVVPIVECPVHAPRANALAFALHAHLARARVSSAGPALRGVLRHLIVRTTRDGREVVAMLVVTRNDKSLRPPIRAFLSTEHAPDGLYLNVHDRPGPFMVGRDTTRLAGRSHVRETVGAFSYLLSPTTFFQTNVEAAGVLVDCVLRAIGDRPALNVLDLYAGSGLFTLPLAGRGHHVTAVEENGQAIKDAEANLRLNRMSSASVRLHAARVEDVLPRLQRERCDVVVLDPPRQGCDPAVLRAVFTRLRPELVVYVSCNPEALAAELPAIVEAGYRVRRVQPVDMFPHTTHIETVVTLTAPTPRPRRGSGVSRSS
jgi:23S rRNA (uracil1939-C5)-methyltransferase